MTDVKFGKRVFTLAVVAMTILWTMAAGLTPLMTNAQVSLSAGDLIKGESFSTVYYYGSDGMRYTFPNENTYFTWYSDFSGVTTISDSQLAGISLGAQNIVYRPGTNWIKVQSVDDVYAVSSDGTLHWIESQDVADALYGSSNWASFIHDVPDTFFPDYTIGASLMSADSLYDGALVSDGSQTYLMSGTELRPVSAAGMSANRLQSRHVLSTSVELSALTAGAELSSYSAELSDTAQLVVGDEPAVAGSLSYSVASTTPAGVTIPGGANGVEMTRWAFTAGSEAAQLDSLVLTLGGIGATTNFSNVYLYEGTVRLTEGRSVNSATRTATFSNLNLSVAAGATRYISAVASTATSLSAGGETASFGIASASSVGSAGTVSGSSAYGNTFTFSNSNAGSLTITKNGTITNPSLGEQDAVIGQFNISVATEDASLRRMRLNIDDAVDHSDFQLWQGSTMIATGVRATGDNVDFEFATPFVVAEGNNRIFKVTADIGGNAADTVKVYVNSTPDVVAVGGDFGFNMSVDIATSGTYDGTTCTSTAGNCSYSTIQGGDVTFTFNGPVSSDIPTDATDVTLMAFTLNTAQDVTVKDLDVIMYCDDNADADPFDGTNDAGADTDGCLNSTSGDFNIQDISIRMADTGSRLMGPLELASATEVSDTVDFTDDFFMAGGTTYNLLVTGDIDNDAPTSLSLGVTIDMSGVSIEDGNGDALTLGTDIVPLSDIVGNVFTTSAPSLAVALASSPTSFTTVQGSTSETVLGLTLTAGSAEDVTVTSFLFDAYADDTSVSSTDFTLGGTSGATAAADPDVADYFASCSMYNGANELLAGPVGATSSGQAFSFTNTNFAVPAGEVMLVKLKCNLHNPSGTANTYFAFDVDDASANLTVQDTDGDTVTATGDGPNGDIDGGTAPTVAVTVDDAGTLTIAGDSSSPNASILLAGTSNNLVSTFRATSTLEDFVITTLTFDEVQAGLDGQAAGAYANNIAGVVLGYTNSEGAPATNTAYMTSNRVTFSGLSLPVDNDSVTKFNVSVNIPVIDRTSGGSATSGEKLTLGFSDGDNSGSDHFRAVGQGSGSVLGESSVSDNTTNINTFVVRETMPTVNLHASSPSGAKVPGLAEALRFTVSASSGEDVIIDEMIFQMSATDNTAVATLWHYCDTSPPGSEWVDGDFTLYKTSNLSDPLEDASTDWNQLKATGAACDGTGVALGFLQIEGLADDITIAAGTTETFSLYVDTTGASSSADDSIRWDIPADPIPTTSGLWLDTGNNFNASDAVTVTGVTHDDAAAVGAIGDVICSALADTTCDAAEERMLITSQDSATATVYNVYRGYQGSTPAATVATNNILYLPSSFVWFDDGDSTPSTTVYDDAVAGAYLVDNLPITGGTIVF